LLILLSLTCIADVPNHPFMTKESSNNDYRGNHKRMAEVSIDSGRGTMSTGIISRMSSAPSKTRPVPAVHNIQADIPEVKENSVDDFSRMPSAALRHPPSPPVRLRDTDKNNSASDRMFPEKYSGAPAAERSSQFIDRTPKTNHSADFVSKGSDTGYCSASRHSNSETESRSQRTYNDVPRLNLAQFDPAKYQSQSSSTSGWSCSASVHSNDVKASSPRDPSDVSGQDSIRQLPNSVSGLSNVSSIDGGDFSLQNTKKVLNFDSESQPASLSEQVSHCSEKRPTNTSTEAAHSNLCVRSNSVDELEFDRPRQKARQMRSNSCDLLDVEVPREATGATGSDMKATASTAVPGVSEKQLSEMGAPICSNRLRPIRQRTRNAVVNIMESGDVCLEFVKQKHKEEKVVEVFVISNSGMQISIYQPNNGRGVTVEDQPVALPKVPLKSFSYAELPEKYWKKYQYASRFVKLVRSKTPKVTLYTQRCKCMLMENGPDADFEAVFYDGRLLFVVYST